MDHNGDKAFHILALDGGGARGIYPAQLLAQIEQSLGVSIAECFDLIVGTSTGSIVAGASAAGIPMTEVVGLFETESSRIFRKRPLRSFLFQSRYSREPLESVVRRCVGSLTLGEVSTPLLITSSDLHTGGVHVFKSAYLGDLGEPYSGTGTRCLASPSAPHARPPPTSIRCRPAGHYWLTVVCGQTTRL